MMSSEPIGQEIVISGPERRWVSTILVVLGVLGALQGLLMLARQGPGGAGSLLLTIGGGTLIVMGVLFHFRIRTQRRTLQITSQGFLYTTRLGTREFQDSDVMCVSYAIKANYSGGNLQAFTRRFAVWVEAEPVPERILVSTKLRTAMFDPLGGWINRVIQGLLQDAQAAYAAGESVEGEGWRLERGKLIASSKKSHEYTVLTLAEIQAVDEVENHLCIWRHGEDRPVVRIPADRANAHLLRLLLEQLAPRVADDQSAEPGALGRMLFERKRSSMPVVLLICVLLGMMICLPCLLLVVAGAVEIQRGQADGWIMLIVGSVLMAISALGIWLVWRSRRLTFRGHAHGIKNITLFREQVLPFDAVAAFTYAATKVYTHGVYVGTTVVLQFTPLPGMGLKPVRFTAMLKGDDVELDRLKDQVSSIVARKMLDAYEATGNVPWLPHVRFQGETLEFRSLGMLGRKAQQVIPLRDLSTWDFLDGSFRLFGPQLKKPLLVEGTGQPNFFPGLIVLQELLRRRVLAQSGADADDLSETDNALDDDSED